MTWTRRTRMRFPSRTRKKWVRTPRPSTSLNQCAEVRQRVSPLCRTRAGITLSNTLIWSVKTNSSSVLETSYTSLTLPLRRNRMNRPSPGDGLDHLGIRVAVVLDSVFYLPSEFGADVEL